MMEPAGNQQLTATAMVLVSEAHEHILISLMVYPMEQSRETNESQREGSSDIVQVSFVQDRRHHNTQKYLSQGW